MTDRRAGEGFRLDGTAAISMLLVSIACVLLVSCTSAAGPSTTGAGTSSAGPPAQQVPAGMASVPKTVGASKSSAMSALQNAGLVPLMTVVVTSTAAPGSVIAQFPEAGTIVAEDSQVSFAVAQAAAASALPAVPAPNTYQMTKPQAQSLVMSFGLAPAFAEGPSVEAAGTAFAQLPAFGDTVAQGGTVLVLLSNGHAPQPATTTIPDVVGKSEADARQALTAANLKSQSVSGLDAAVKGTVFAQLPAAGGKIAAATPIVLGVSLGPSADSRFVTVPAVTHVDGSAAAAALTQVGLRVQQADVAGLSEPAGKVAGQVPLQGGRCLQPLS